MRDMAKKVVKKRTVKTGYFKVRPAKGASHRGEAWEIVGPTGRVRKTVVTSPSSAAALDEITEKHLDSLKRLAKK